MVGISGLDTRHLTQRIRDRGAPSGALCHAPDGMLDIAELHEVDELSGGHAITYEDCVNAEERQGGKVRSGDILLLRTGMMAKARNGDVISYGSGTPVDGSPMPGFPGVGLGAVEFFYDREVAAVATDTIT